MPHGQPALTQVSINIRAKAWQRDLIDQAAERQGRSRSDFMLDASCREAEGVLLSQTFFTVDADTFAKFEALLDKPLPPTDKLRRLLKTKRLGRSEPGRDHGAGADYTRARYVGLR